MCLYESHQAGDEEIGFAARVKRPKSKDDSRQSAPQMVATIHICGGSDIARIFSKAAHHTA